MTTLQEEWRPVVGYEGFYEVSNLGGVRSCTRIVRHGRYGNDNHVKRLKGRPLTPTVGSHGYESVMLSRLGVATRRLVHDLVTEAFLGAREPGLVVNHRDLNRLNNRVVNLEYVSQKENLSHARARGHSCATLTPEEVMGTIARFDSGASVKSLAKEYGVSRDTIRGIVYGHSHTVITGRALMDGRRVRWQHRR